MRSSLVLVIATAMFAFCDAAASGSTPAKLSISKSADSLQTDGAVEIVGKRILRGSNAKKNGYFTDEDDEEDEEDEERALPNLSKIDDEANLSFMVKLFQNWDEIGKPGVTAYLAKEKMSLDEMLSITTFYQQYRTLGTDDFKALMRKVTAP